MESSNPAASPVDLERNNSRCPLLSLSTVAVTPALAPLILLATSLTVSAAATTISTGLAPTCAVNSVGTWVHFPSCKRIVPAPMAPSTGNKATDAVAWACASLSTLTAKLLAVVPPIALAATALLLEDVALTALYVVRLFRLDAASERVEISDLTWAKAEMRLCTVAACTCSLLKG